MARTTHHTSWRQRTSERIDDANSYLSRWRRTEAPGPAIAGAPIGAEDAQTWNVTTTLRYPASERDRTDRRPQPQPVTRTYASYRYSRAFHGSAIDAACGPLERAERARVRTQLSAATTAARGLASGDGAWDDADFDVAPTRHRGSARRFAC